LLAGPQRTRAPLRSVNVVALLDKLGEKLGARTVGDVFSPNTGPVARGKSE